MRRFFVGDDMPLLRREWLYEDGQDRTVMASMSNSSLSQSKGQRACDHRSLNPWKRRSTQAPGSGPPGLRTWKSEGGGAGKDVGMCEDDDVETGVEYQAKQWFPVIQAEEARLDRTEPGSLDRMRLTLYGSGLWVDDSFSTRR